MRRLRRFLGLSPEDRRLLLRAWRLQVVIRLGLWLLPFRLVRRRVASTRHRVEPSASAETDHRIGWAVTSAARYVPAATCLTQALAAKVLLNDAGRGARLTIGVERDVGSLRAHAWVEGDEGVIVGNHDLERFTVLPSIEGEVP
ncbi:MAG: lasso peptide biosynthesis B2 protein [Actinomycetota bacterium]|nr:lasso peptide biosynthesis B2 protein [Actinomycetota bacterium]